MAFVITPQATPCVPVVGTDELFPVHRIYCVGRNYGDHVKEMGGDPKQEAPVFFSKPATALVLENADVSYPQATNDLHHEVELVVALKSGGKRISLESALDCVYGYAVGIDFTRRDLQTLAKNHGRPWDVAKGFDQSAPISSICPSSKCGHPADAQIHLKINNQLRQQAKLDEMIWSVPEIISELSNFFEMKPGDLIYTGTPAGVSAVEVGDKLSAGIEGVGEIEFNII